jgi:hypothetical protein
VTPKRHCVAIDANVEHGQAGRLLDLHVRCALRLAQHRSNLLGRPVHLVKSSPNTFTAMSPRTPAISSLKRIWMGWVIS